jgi:hypothetical protein
MNAQVRADIFAEINAHMQKAGVALSRWYVGVTADIDTRLFGSHNVTRENSWYIYRRAINSTEARAIEKAYHDAGCNGAGGGGDNTAVYVYAYIITATTVE